MLSLSYQDLQSAHELIGVQTRSELGSEVELKVLLNATLQVWEPVWENVWMVVYDQVYDLTGYQVKEQLRFNHKIVDL